MPRKTLTLLGILLVLIQISGVPHSWKTIFGILVGIYLVFIAMRGASEKSHMNFENNEINQNTPGDDSKKTEVGN